MERLLQGSTWAGLGVLLNVLATFFPAYALPLHMATAAAAAAAGVINS